ncbi:hypothetical protein [Rhizobium sp. RCAM05973]|uniref:hypothetical protein n=1 Tax=Rhizobium sp. RCAM05973 TaxID=2994066 RepID=UPI0022EBF63C|nr:hypothetical protein [Rhizobium sp. RCAM05973]
MPPKKKPTRAQTRKTVNPDQTNTQATAARVPDTVAARVSATANLGTIWDRIGKARKPTEFRVACIRPDDLLVCDFIFENLQLDLERQDGPRLVRKDPHASTTLIVELPHRASAKRPSSIRRDLR